MFSVPLPSNPLLAGVMLYAIFYIGHFVFWVVVEVLHNYSQTRAEVIGMVDALGVATGKVASIPATSLADMARRKRMAIENFNAIAEGRTPPHAALPPPPAKTLPAPVSKPHAVHASVPQDAIERAYRVLGYYDTTRLGDTIEAHDAAFAMAHVLYTDAQTNGIMKVHATPSMVQGAWTIICADNRWRASVLYDKKVIDAVYARLSASTVAMPVADTPKEAARR